MNSVCSTIVCSANCTRCQCQVDWKILHKNTIISSLTNSTFLLLLIYACFTCRALRAFLNGEYGSPRLKLNLPISDRTVHLLLSTLSQLFHLNLPQTQSLLATRFAHFSSTMPSPRVKLLLTGSLWKSICSETTVATARIDYNHNNIVFIRQTMNT